MRSAGPVDWVGSGTAMAALTFGGEECAFFDAAGVDSSESGVPCFGAECKAVKPGLGGLSWAPGVAGGDLRRRQTFPGNVLPRGRLAGAGRDARLCETQ